MKTLRQGTSLESIRKEPHSQSVYILSDELNHEWLLLAQKLRPLAAYVNERVGDGAQRLTAASLYDITSGRTKGDRTGHLVKYRWCVRKVKDRQEAVAQFNSLSGCGFDHVALLGPEGCYEVR